MNEFEHDGNPDRKQQVEILKVIALAAGFAVPCVASGLKTWETWQPVWIGAFLFLAIPTIWSTALAFLAVKGRSKLATPDNAAIILAGLVAIGFALAIGTFFGVAVSRW